jgi:hypothetical protein
MAFGSYSSGVCYDRKFLIPVFPLLHRVMCCVKPPLFFFKNSLIEGSTDPSDGTTAWANNGILTLSFSALHVQTGTTFLESNFAR